MEVYLCTPADLITDLPGDNTDEKETDYLIGFG